MRMGALIAISRAHSQLKPGNQRIMSWDGSKTNFVQTDIAHFDRCAASFPEFMSEPSARDRVKQYQRDVPFLQFTAVAV